jgi:TonB family protein
MRNNPQVKRKPRVNWMHCQKTVVYPPQAQTSGLEGTVHLKVIVDAAGKISDAQVLRAAGHGFDEAAVDALLHRCAADAAIGTDGQPVAYAFSYDIVFDLAMWNNPLVKTLPDVNPYDCARAATYTLEAARERAEGEVKLRVWIDEHGTVTKAVVKKGLGYGLDEAAVEALTTRCRFKPAIGEDGTPVAFVIPYTFEFINNPVVRSRSSVSRYSVASHQ